MPEEPQQRTNWARLSGIGFELAAAVLACTAVGYWVDRHFKSDPWGLLIGFALGLTGGMYNMIRQTLLVARQEEKERHGER